MSIDAPTRLKSLLLSRIASVAVHRNWWDQELGILAEFTEIGRLADLGRIGNELTGGIQKTIARDVDSLVDAIGHVARLRQQGHGHSLAQLRAIAEAHIGGEITGTNVGASPGPGRRSL